MFFVHRARSPAPHAIALAIALLCLTGRADAREPFSFLETPTEQLAVPGHAPGTEITPEGYLYTGHAELAFSLGPRLAPLRAPIRTLAGGRYPVVSSRVRSGGVRYTLTTFAALVAGRPVNFVRVEMRNTSRRRARARFAAAVRHGGGDRNAAGAPRFRFRRPALPERPGLYFQPGEEFAPAARHAFAGRALTRDGRALYLLDRRRGTRVTRRLRPGDGGALGPDTPVGRSEASAVLAPGRRALVDLKMPVTPLASTDAAYPAIARASFDTQRAATLLFWRALLAPAMDVRLPEPKVEDAFYAALVATAQARYLTEGGDWVQAVNKLQYHAFYLRDAAIISNAYDLVGLHRLARENLLFFPSWQRPDGLFLSRVGQYDGHGQALWAIGEHVTRSGDTELGRRLFPTVERGVEWLARARREDPLGLPPPGDPRDNELAAGHLAGDAFWAVAGLERSLELARALGEDAAADRFAAELAGLRASVVAAVRAAAARNGGAIPPLLDSPAGQDWGNLWASYPVQTLAPDDPAVRATVARARGRFREGIATYLDGRLLHHYLGFRVLQTELARGDQEPVVRGLYDALAHTTATHGGFETGIHPYGSRSVDDNPAPHGWYAAEYVALLRNMLVCEEGAGGVVLGSALSRAWLAPGRVVAVRGAPTLAGRVDFSLRARRGGALLRWRAPAGARLRFTVPAGARDVRAPGLARGGREIALGAASGQMRIRWRLPDRPAPTYQRAVDRLRRAYGRRR